MSDKDKCIENLGENKIMEAVGLTGTQAPEAISQRENIVPINENSDEKVGQIVQSVTALAGFVEDYHADLENLQIGDYLLSVNITPLEIQLKRAISSIHLSEVESKSVIHPGDGNVEVPLSLSSVALTTAPNDEITVNSQREIIQKRMNFVTRLRRFFRLGKSPPKNS